MASPVGLDAPGTASQALIVSAALGTVLIAGLSLTVMAFGDIRGPELSGFVWAHSLGYILADVLTAGFLAREAYVHPSRSVAMISAAYAFSAAGHLTFFLTFPGTLVATGPFIGGPQSAPWWYFLTRIGFMGMLLAAAFLATRDRRRPLRQSQMPAYALASFALFVALAIPTILFSDSLPVMLDRTAPSPVTTVGHIVSRTTLLLCVTTLIATVWTARFRSRLRVWLVLVCVLGAADIGIQQLATDRYTLAWYAARLLGVIGGSLLVFLIVTEFSRQASALATSLDRQDQMWEMISAAEDAFLVTDAERTVLWANPKAVELFDATGSPHGLEGRHVEELIPAAEELMEADPPGASLTLTGRRSLTPFPLEASARAVETRDGLMWTISAQDVSVKLDSERELAAARREAQRLAQVVEQSPLGYCVLDVELRIVDANHGLGIMTGRTAAELVGRSIKDLQDAAAEPQIAQALVPLIAGTARRVACRLRYRTADGSLHWADMLAHPLNDPSGRLAGLGLSLVDVTSEMEADTAEYVPIGVATTDGDDRITQANEAMCRLLGRTREDVLGRPLGSFLHEDDGTHDDVLLSRLRTESASNGSMPLRLRQPSRESVWVEMHRAAIRDDEGLFAGCSVQCVDITAQKEAEQAVQTVLADLDYRSKHDLLTGLSNRDAFKESLELQLAQADRSQIGLAQRGNGRWIGVIFVDVDHFKQINDAFSHALGDIVLQQTAQVLSDSIRGGDLVARLAGDEFAVALSGLAHPDDALRVAEHLVKTIATTRFGTESRDLHVTVSAGVTVSQGATQADWILQEADVAMYRAKRSGRNRASSFDEGLRNEMVERLEMASRIRAGLEAREFLPHFQPICELSTGRVVGFEALARWSAADGSPRPSTAAFIDIAEDTGLIVPLGGQVIDRAIASMAELPERYSMAVNVSPSQLLNDDIPGRISAGLDRAGVNPRRLIVEITEAALLQSAETTSASIDALVRRGIGLHVDDFGTGYSSLTHLRDFPVTGIKLDRSFTAGLTGLEGPAAELTAGLASLASRLGLTRIAEGVETVEQAEILRNLGWNLGQGWYLGRPQSMVDLRGGPGLNATGSTVRLPEPSRRAHDALPTTRSAGQVPNRPE